MAGWLSMAERQSQLTSSLPVEGMLISNAPRRLSLLLVSLSLWALHWELLSASPDSGLTVYATRTMKLHDRLRICGPTCVAEVGRYMS